jgi:hypothetical protein
MPVRYIDQVRRHYSDQPAYRWSTFETIPWASLAKPLHSVGSRSCPRQEFT